MIETTAAHWNGVYGAREEEALTWFQADPAPAAEAIAAHVAPGDPVIDVGAGASRLADLLIERGLGPVSVLDISGAALAVSRARMGAEADRVTWIEADITEWEPEARYALWHDRAVFHFLTEPEARAAYVRALGTALRPGGIAMISTFALDGPEKCSNLPVVRYAPETLAAELERLAPGVFELIHGEPHDHLTPKGNVQRFQTSVFRKLRGA